MNTSGVLTPLNEYLTIKSAAILRSVSKSTQYCIKVKEYRYYRIFKKLKTDQLSIIKMLLNSDPTWLEYLAGYYIHENINFHKYGNRIKEYVENTEYYMCVMEFKETIRQHFDENEDITVEQLNIALDNHCNDYTDYEPLFELLVVMCYEEFLLTN